MEGLKMVDKDNEDRFAYLSLMAKEFPTIQAASTEIINLQAILDLPKGTEHFMSDLHGEHEAFLHVLNNASGNIRNKIEILFKETMSDDERADLATLIYYPELKLEQVKKVNGDLSVFYVNTLLKLIDVARHVSTKFTRSKVRKAIPKGFEYIIDELLNANFEIQNKEQYYKKIISTIIDIERSDAFIIAICDLIKHLIIDRLHIVGDIFDRGPRADIIVDRLMKQHTIDIQWGNHDLLWMGAASGSGACIANILNTAIRYDNLDTIEDSYGINLLPLAVFSQATYEANPLYGPKFQPTNDVSFKDRDLLTKMRKAISIILFKLEGQIILRHPEYEMDDRLLLDKINYENQCIRIDGTTYTMEDIDFPTVNRDHPYQLSLQEEYVISKLISSFKQSSKLQDHIKFIYSVGSMYRVYNNNLLFHGCIPMKEDGNFLEFTFNNQTYSGKSLYDYCDVVARQGYYCKEGTSGKQYGEDFLWWLWCGKYTPSAGREKITTFERLFIKDESSWLEPKNSYYQHFKKADTCEKIFKEFGLSDTTYSHIVNGHMPVKFSSGESPLKGEGKALVIDGGFCRAYHKTTGIAGYTMFYNSFGIRLAAHQPFAGIENALINNKDIISSSVVFENASKRILVADTETGKEIKKKIADLKELLNLFRSGQIKEKR